MSKRSNRKGTKVDHYQAITDAIIASLEKGVAPWVCPWDRASGLPHNGHSGHVYRGINTWLCWASGFGDARWFTFNQVKGYGRSHVRKGEKGTKIAFWRFLDKEEEQEDGSIERRSIPMLRVFTVFNFEQVEWDADKAPKTVELRDHDPEGENAEAAAFVASLGANISHGGGRAFYRPSTDSIQLPERGSFETTDGYWSTMFHELTHWTGSDSRCSRDLSNRFGSEGYAMEELVAELGAAFLCGDLGVRGSLQHESYIANWLTVLRSDNRAIFTAQSCARKAVEWMYDATKAEEVEAAA